MKAAPIRMRAMDTPETAIMNSRLVRWSPFSGAVYGHLLLLICMLICNPIGSGAFAQDQDVQFDRLMRMLNDPVPIYRKTAANALSYEGRRAVQPLINALNDTDQSVLETVIYSLARLRDKRAIAPLSEVLQKQPIASVRAEAASVLAEFDDAEVVEALIKGLQDNDDVVVESAISGLGHFSNDERVVLPLIAMLANKNSQIRSAAATAMVEVNDRRVVSPLVAALKDSDPYVRRAAASGLLKFASDNPEVAKALLSGLALRDVDIIRGAYQFFIRKGAANSEGALVVALEQDGDKEMAEYFINSGNPKLTEAARKWALDRGYQVKSAETPLQRTWRADPN
jgi:HEAT repeat protein